MNDFERRLAAFTLLSRVDWIPHLTLVDCLCEESEEKLINCRYGLEHTIQQNE